MTNPFVYLWGRVRAVGDAFDRLARAVNGVCDQIEARHEGADDPPLVEHGNGVQTPNGRKLPVPANGPKRMAGK